MICFICSKYIKKGIQLHDRLTICKNCFQKNGGFKCQGCGLYYLERDFRKNNLCRWCYKGMTNNDHQKLFVHNYFFKPYPTFFNISNQLKLFMGVQLQIGGTTIQNVNKFSVQNQSQFFYIKYDSTIPKYGCQIVSYPATLQYHQSNKSNWKQILKNASKYRFKSFDINDCGLHIHVNKDFFTNQQIAIIDFFVNSNKQLISQVSRRNSLFSRFLNKPIWLYGIPLNRNRHCVLNLLNENTIQFRFFKGTINYESVMAYLQFIYCLCLFIKNFQSIQQFSKINNTETFLQYCLQIKQLKYLSEYFKKIKLNIF